MTAPDYIQAIYDHIRESGGPGDVVRTDIFPWLQTRYGLSRTDAARIRRQAMKELRRRGLVERINIRGPNVHILA